MQRRFQPLTVAVALSAAIVTALALPTHAGGQPPMYGKGQPASIEELPPGRIRDRLESLSPAARERALEWLQRLEFPASDLEVLQIDDQGGILYADPMPPPLPDDERD